MKKNLTLSFLLMSLMVFSFGVVSAQSGDIEVIISALNITSPSEGDYISNNVLISWENMTFGTGYLMYNEGICDGTPSGEFIFPKEPIANSGSRDWDTSDLEDGNYCIKIVWGNEVYGDVSVIKDTTAPTITFENTPYFNRTSEVVPIKINISEANEIDEWELDFGDGSLTIVNTTKGIISADYTYSAEGTYTVILTVTDKAGNTAVETSMVVINNEEVDWIIPLYSDKFH